MICFQNFFAHWQRVYRTAKETDKMKLSRWSKDVEICPSRPFSETHLSLWSHTWSNCCHFVLRIMRVCAMRMTIRKYIEHRLSSIFFLKCIIFDYILKMCSIFVVCAHRLPNNIYHNFEVLWGSRANASNVFWKPLQIISRI